MGDWPLLSLVTFLPLVGVVLMLVIAAMLEGYGRQLVGETGSRFTIGGFMLAFWLAYFFVFRRRGEGDAA